MDTLQSVADCIQRNDDEPCEVDGGIDTSDQEEESYPQMPYYHGFNSPPGVHDTPSDRENCNELEMCGVRDLGIGYFTVPS